MSNDLDLLKIDSVISDFFSDKYVTASLVLFLILYICFVSPKLHKNCSVFKFMNSNVFQLAILLFLGYVSSKNYSVGLLLMGAFFATLFTMQTHQVNDKIVSIVVLDSINSGRAEQIEKQKHVQFNLPKEKTVEIPAIARDVSNKQINVIHDASNIMKQEAPNQPMIMQDIGRVGANSREQNNGPKREQSIRGPSGPISNIAAEEHFDVTGFENGDFAEYLN